MFVIAASAAYAPPEARVPQMVIAMSRPPTSRAELAAIPFTLKPHTIMPLQPWISIEQRDGMTQRVWGKSLLCKPDHPRCSGRRNKQIRRIKTCEDDQCQREILQCPHNRSDYILYLERTTYHDELIDKSIPKRRPSGWI
jgi:hypothetical protein